MRCMLWCYATVTTTITMQMSLFCIWSVTKKVYQIRFHLFIQVPRKGRKQHIVKYHIHTRHSQVPENKHWNGFLQRTHSYSIKRERGVRKTSSHTTAQITLKSGRIFNLLIRKWRVQSWRDHHEFNVLVESSSAGWCCDGWNPQCLHGAYTRCNQIWGQLPIKRHLYCKRGAML